MTGDTHNRSSDQPAEEARLLRLATGASVLVALLLIAAKTVAFALTGAVSLLASLVDSLVDAAASLLNLFAVRYALAPRDREHRFGHGKAESLAALVQSVLIIGSAAYLIYTAVNRLLDPQPVQQLAAGIAVTAFAIAATGALVLLQQYVIRRTHSAAIKADSLHYRSDLLSNLAVLAALALAGWGFPSADPLLAMAIAVYLVVASREILGQALNELLDRELPARQRQQILDAARAHPQVHNVHDLRTRRAGRTVIAQLHIELDRNMPLLEAHDIADEVEEAIRAVIPGVDLAIHQDPVGISEPRLDAEIARKNDD